MNRTLNQLTAAACAAFIGAAGLSQASAATINVTTNINKSTTWTADNEYILTQVIYVTDGATLSIEEGTVIRGEPESSGGANDPGTLVITRDAKICAIGTEKRPIVFTDLNDDNIGTSSGTLPYDTLANVRGLTEQWGGLILLGRTYVANGNTNSPNATKEVQIEGLTSDGGLGLYGNGGDDDDDSGVLRYVIIRLGGFNLSAANEINGLTLGAVGRETGIDHIEIVNNKDDGVEFFGGTVNTKYMAVAFPGDDTFDWDEGFRGKGQFWFSVKGLPGPDKSDKTGELDGGNSPDASGPFAIPTIYNATFIGHGETNENAKAFTDSAKDTGMHMRDNTGGRLYNSAWLDFGGTTVLIEGTSSSSTGSNSAGERSITAYTIDAFQVGPVSDFQLEYQDNCFWCFGAGSTIPTAGTNAVAAGADSGDSGKFHHDNGLFTNAALDNDYLPCTDPLPITSLARTDLLGDPFKPNMVTTLDPRPAVGSALLTTDRTPPSDGFFQSAGFKGAFSASVNWLKDWTTLDRLGVLAAHTNPDTTVDLVTATTDVELDVPTVTGVDYSVLVSSDLKYWEVIGFIDGDGSVVTFVDTDPLSTAMFYQVVAH